MIISTDADEIMVITLDRSPVNAMNVEDLENFLAGVQSAFDGAAQAILITSLNEAFCAGLDREMLNSDTFKKAIALLRELIKTLATSPIPLAAAINGHCLGAGMALLLTCDQRIAVDANYRFGFPETRLGIPTSLQLFSMLERSTGSVLAQKMTVECLELNPQQAVEANLVDQLVAPGEAEAAAKAGLLRLLDLPRTTMLETRRISRNIFFQLYGGQT